MIENVGMSCLLVSNQVTNKPIVVYPNSGEHYDPVIKQWVVSLHPLNMRLFLRPVWS